MTSHPLLPVPEPLLDIDTIFHDLRSAGRTLPRRALLAAVAQQQAITPHLIALLEATTRDPAPALATSDDFSVLAALYLLAQFREPAAYRAVIGLCSLPPATVDLLLGHSLTERGEVILAGVYDGDPAPLQGLIENPDAYEYARSAAIGALVTLVAYGSWPRDAAVAYFRSLLTDRLEREPSYVWDALIGACKDVHPRELLKEIGRAYDEDLVDEGMVGDFEDVEVQAALGLGATLAELRRSPSCQWVTDVVEETEWWDWFNPASTSRRHDLGAATRASPYAQMDGGPVRKVPAKADKAKAKKKRKIAKAARRGNR